jgi:hypothetical protein
MSLVDDYECRVFRPSRLMPPSAKQEAAVVRPTCPQCDLDMWLIRAEPHAILTAYDVWRFECPSCNDTKEMTVDR